MTHDELIAEMEALQAQLAALLHKVREPVAPTPSPFSGGGPGEER